MKCKWGLPTGRNAFALLFIVGGLGFAPSAVSSDDGEFQHYFSFGLAYTYPDSARSVDYGLGGSVAYAHRLSPRLWWEAKLFANVLETNVSGTGGFSQTGIGLDLLLPMGPENQSHFFFLLGGGAVQNDVTPDSKDGGSGYVNAGVGWRFKPRLDLGLRPRIELRSIADSFDEGQSDVLLGLVLELAPRRERAEVAVAPARIVRIEWPPPVIVAALPPADADGDGVPDEDDRCPDTIAGATVEPDGCVGEAQVITLANLQFETASAALTATSRERLDHVARFFLNQSDVAVDIYGHTDDQGSDAYNLKLSEGRASSVRKYLVKKGIAPPRLTSKGFGESKPIDTNKTKEGRARNRRVELHIHPRQP